MGIPVLVVDSNVDHGKRIKKSLEVDRLFQVTLATRAIEALMRFTETKYQVAIVDFGLPDLNGVDLIRQMRGIDENIIVVAILDKVESPSKNIEQLAINAVLDRSTYLSNLPQRLPHLLNLPSPIPSAQKVSSSASIFEAQIKKDEGIQEKTIQDKTAQEAPLMEEAIHQESPRQGTPQGEMVLKESRPEGAAPLEAAPTEATQHSDKEDASIQDETSREDTLLEEDHRLQISQEEPSHIEQTQDNTATIPPWLKEPAQVEKYLAYFEQDHSAYATLLSIGNTPWTYSEQLTENQAHGIVRLLSEHDEGLQSKGALIRYIRLEGSGNDYLLYATPVIGDINLSMIFSMETPFSVARRQTHKLSRLLIEQDPRGLIVKEEKPIIEKLISVSREEDEPLLPSGWIPSPKISTKKPEPAQVSPSSPAMEEPERERVMAPSLTAAPKITPIPNDWLPKEPRPTAHLPFLEQDTPQSEKIRELEPINLTQQEPRYYLPFTAILLPRFPNHRLTGSLANQLENWLKDLCVAWGWRVENIDLRSEFLRFTFSLSPDIAPAQAVQHLANNLSSRILKAFPGLTKDLPAGQFWTKSYLLTAGSDVGKDRLASFIELTRREQGLVN
ncbi:MAG: hypothetical protein A2Z14_19250 [Chloroflexi bacterium RBG_16_48_8]|nr:MAG: hypothetical protein A2Z14_19250 [Chloroflexi bacterium RBG_16_48_8]